MTLFHAQPQTVAESLESQADVADDRAEERPHRRRALLDPFEHWPSDVVPHPPDDGPETLERRHAKLDGTHDNLERDHDDSAQDVRELREPRLMLVDPLHDVFHGGGHDVEDRQQQILVDLLREVRHLRRELLDAFLVFHEPGDDRFDDRDKFLPEQGDEVGYGRLQRLPLAVESPRGSFGCERHRIVFPYRGRGGVEPLRAGEDRRIQCCRC